MSLLRLTQSLMGSGTRGTARPPVTRSIWIGYTTIMVVAMLCRFHGVAIKLVGVKASTCI